MIARALRATLVVAKLYVQLGVGQQVGVYFHDNSASHASFPKMSVGSIVPGVNYVDK